VNTLAISLALLSAATFAVSTSVQHQAAERAPESAGRFTSLVLHLVQRPSWLIAQSVAVAGFVLHGLALRYGPIALVQPIVISGIVLIVPTRAAISRRLPSLPELRAVALTALGLGVFLVASNPSAGEHADLGARPAVFAAVAAAIALLTGLLARLSSVPTRRAFLLGVASGVLFGLVAGMLKLALQELADGGVLRLLTVWPTYAVVVAGTAGVLTNQLAYRTARLSASMPVLNIVDGLGALAAGVLIFREVPRTSPGWLAAELGALVCIAVGLRMVALLDEAACATTEAPSPVPEPQRT
jgi:hypothetical protein